MEPLYKPQGVEERWQRVWEEEGLYAAETGSTKPPFVICIPPPNVTGELHMGHALNASIQDLLIRWHRMRGFNALWQPGYDHAGIALQNVIEKQLRHEGKTRHDLGREAFVARVWEFLDEYGGVIVGQLRNLGASLDYRRMRFTVDEAYSRSVMRFFLHLYERGFVYRDNRIGNWCPRCMSAISELEVDHGDVDDALVYARYPLADGGGAVTVATVRPATILADTAVAVHPDDARYRAFVGKDVIVPWVERRVPVIADERVEREFGTGALKVTPGHDATDFEIGRAHGLPEPSVIGWDGRMNEAAGELAGLTQAEAGERVVAWLRERGQLEKREAYRHAVGTCNRCGTRIEPLISLQWWCEMEQLVQPAIDAIEGGRVRFYPPSQGRFAVDSMRAIPPWCLSRQLWWGHQLPVWYCPDGHVTVADGDPAACGDCGSADLQRDEDVLDTWFSSALWPFATLGWPDDTPELRAFYPGDVNSTDRQIIRLWVNRMIWAGIELRGEAPFHSVNIHSTINAPDGRRMAKSLGTGIDPTDAVREHGADATRYGLLKMSSTQDVRYSVRAIEEGRSLANKLWNVARLILAGTEGVTPALRSTALEERWILARLEAARAGLERDLAGFDFSHAVDRLYHVTFDDFCDWYAEAIKPRLRDADADAQATALAALERLLALLHPVMPHVTEEIWTSLPDRETRLIVAPWPQPGEQDGEAAGALDRVQEAAAIFRRSGVVVELDGEERRIFEAVVRPERQQANGDASTEIQRLRGEIARAEAMLANERFVERAPREVVDAERAKLERYRRELEALERSQ